MERIKSSLLPAGWKREYIFTATVISFCFLSVFFIAGYKMLGSLNTVSILQIVGKDIGSAASLEDETKRTMEEYLRWGGLLGRVNPELTHKEKYEIGKAVSDYSRLYNLSPELIIATIIVESRGERRAVSPRGAVGLMQIMPWWPKELGINGDLLSIDTNIRIGTLLLADNIKKWGYKEGILRYNRGGLKTDDGYFVKIQKTIKELAG